MTRRNRWLSLDSQGDDGLHEIDWEPEGLKALGGEERVTHQTVEQQASPPAPAQQHDDKHIVEDDDEYEEEYEDEDDEEDIPDFEDERLMWVWLFSMSEQGKAHGDPLEFRGYDVDGSELSDLPSRLSKAPFCWQYLDKTFDMEFQGGFVGVAQDQETLTLKPEIGWAVREVPAQERDKEMP